MMCALLTANELYFRDELDGLSQSVLEFVSRHHHFR